MNIYFPKNLFTQVLIESLPDKIKSVVSIQPSALLNNKLNGEPGSVALIPITDLIGNKELFVSAKIGLGFEGELCNSYLYYLSDENSLSEFVLGGDMSSAEVILTKLLFRELYDKDLDITIAKDIYKVTGKNLLIAGNDNFQKTFFSKGISYSEEIIDLISAPFINYVLASNDAKNLLEVKDVVLKFCNSAYEILETKNYFVDIAEKASDYISMNAGSVIYAFEESDKDAITELIKLTYYHNLVDDMFDIKFV